MTALTDEITAHLATNYQSLTDTQRAALAVAVHGAGPLSAWRDNGGFVVNDGAFLQHVVDTIAKAAPHMVLPPPTPTEMMALTAPDAIGEKKLEAYRRAQHATPEERLAAVDVAALKTLREEAATAAAETKAPAAPVARAATSDEAILDASPHAHVWRSLPAAQQRSLLDRAKSARFEAERADNVLRHLKSIDPSKLSAAQKMTLFRLEKTQ